MENVVLLADPNSKAWDFAQKIKNYLHQEKKSDVPLESVEIREFGNKETEMYVPSNLRGLDVYFIHDITKPANDWWVEMELLGDLFWSSSANKVTFVLPDMYYSRQDAKEKSHVPISARALARVISRTIEASRIISMDLHARQIQGFYDARVPFDSLSSFPAVVRHIKSHNSIPLENLVVVATDVGDIRRASEYKQALNSRKLAFVYKERSITGEREIGEAYFVGDVREKNVLLIDDMISSGRTNLNAGRLVKENGAEQIFTYATHGWFTDEGKKGELLGFFNKVIISNTHNKVYDPRIEVVDVSPVFAEAIYRAQVGESISSLFRLENNSS